MKEDTINLYLLHPVVLAENYSKLVEWYIKTFDLTVQYNTEGEENYTALEYSGQLIVGIAIAREMGVKPSVPRNNTVIIQLTVSDINRLFTRASKTGGKILFGPSLDEKGGYWYGGLIDIEGNQIWVVEEK